MSIEHKNVIDNLQNNPDLNESGETLVNARKHNKELCEHTLEIGRAKEEMGESSRQANLDYNIESDLVTPEDGEHLNNNLKEKKEAIDKQTGIELKEKKEKRDEQISKAFQGVETFIGNTRVETSGPEYSGDNVSEQETTGEAPNVIQQKFTLSGNAESPNETYQEAA